MKIEDIDKNFKTAELDGKPVRFYNAHVAPFSVEGFPWRNEGDLTFYRLPRNLTADDVNEGALYLSHNTAGGVIRFRTNSKYIAIRAKLVYSGDMNHMPRAGSAGFDLYIGSGVNAFHVGGVRPNRDQPTAEQLLFAHPDPKGKMIDYILNLPLYGGCEAIEIGLAPEARLRPPSKHKYDLPVLFYGSSITQGGCASRPGNAYPSRLCRTLRAPQVNLGFSGSGRGEIAVANAIASIPLAAFVFDYDHNAPTAEHLEATHEAFFKAIRAAQPELPVIIMNKCNIWFEYGEDCPDVIENRRRRDIIKRTYENALKAGDKNVYFVDGETLFGKSERSACTVDGCHPNDLGFDRMYRAVLPILKKALKKRWGK